MLKVRTHITYTLGEADKRIFHLDLAERQVGEQSFDLVEVKCGGAVGSVEYARRAGSSGTITHRNFKLLAALMYLSSHSESVRALDLRLFLERREKELNGTGLLEALNMGLELQFNITVEEPKPCQS